MTARTGDSETGRQSVILSDELGVDLGEVVPGFAALVGQMRGNSER